MEGDLEFNLESGEIVEKQTASDPEPNDVNDAVSADSNANVLHDDDEYDEQHDDTPVNGADEDERAAIRERRREERKNRKQAAREREDNLRRELAARDSVISELRGKVDAIERRNSSSELAQLDTAITQAGQVYGYFKDQIRIATEQNNGTMVADATEKMLQTQQRLEHLKRVKGLVQQRQATPAPLDPRLANNAQVWMDKNNWYNPQGTDMDSKITLQIDQSLADEGWDPTTREYWQELDNRVKKYLPHRANSGKIPTRTPKTVVTGSGRENATANTNGTFRLSAERIQAIKDAGMWDDPKQRQAMIRRYHETDKQSKA